MIVINDTDKTTVRVFPNDSAHGGGWRLEVPSDIHDSGRKVLHETFPTKPHAIEAAEDYAICNGLFIILIH